MMWWHRVILKHSIRKVQVSVPMWDWSSKGLLYKCSCEKAWAK